ncbi:MAG: thiamine phosphate synthase [Lentisphaeria bacterium]|nr:thiamine phosphate synthase [Lentisphaeria bacterium]NQZ69098.1 thiamine phosphate synthase [Lentisphaeria bacterium]
MNKNERIALFNDVDIYPVTCEDLSNGRSDIEICTAIIAGGAKIIQLRDKNSSKKEIYEKAVIFRKLTAAENVLLIINDHTDIAQAVDADGVHLGQDDLSLEAARKLIPEKIIGISSHCLDDALLAEKGGADYVNIGPIYQTKTKGGLSDFLGAEKIPDIANHLSIPFTVMGGIKAGHIAELKSYGATKLAVVTEITQADDIPLRVKELIDLIRNS